MSTSRFPGLIALALMISSCGGSGGGGSSTPTISNLQYSPSGAFGGTGPAMVSGTVQFSDPGGDLASLHLTTSAGASQTVSIATAAGQTSGTLHGILQIDTIQLGHYSFEIWVVDSGGNASNHLTGTFDVVLGDLAQSWTVRNTNVTPQLNKVIWAGNRFVAVGYTGTIVTSPDGNTWTAQASGTQAVLTDVTWTGTQYVAVGNDSNNPVVLTSPDAVTWALSASSLPGYAGAYQTARHVRYGALRSKHHACSGTVMRAIAPTNRVRTCASRLALHSAF